MGCSASPASPRAPSGPCTGAGSRPRSSPRPPPSTRSASPCPRPAPAAPAARTDVVLLGFGKVGRMLARLIAQRNGAAPALRAMAVVDSTGFVFDPKGLSKRRLAALAAAKGHGAPLSGVPGGHAGDAHG